MASGIALEIGRSRNSNHNLAFGRILLLHWLRFVVAVELAAAAVSYALHFGVLVGTFAVVVWVGCNPSSALVAFSADFVEQPSYESELGEIERAYVQAEFVYLLSKGV